MNDINGKQDMDINKDGRAVYERLLWAAEFLFGEKGFDGTSVREITQKAGCNVAAVNYHFGSKEKLYQALFISRLKVIRDIRVASIDSVMSAQEGERSLEKLLISFAAAFLEPFGTDEKSIALMKLITWEMLVPRLERTVFYDYAIGPVMEKFVPAVRGFCPGLSEDKIMLCIHSYIGQLIHILRVEVMLANAGEKKIPDRKKFVEHIVEFTAEAIKSIEGKR